jgi:DNA-binding winged helix-turn-helix (wHTH) protein/TolB-like protein
MDRSRSIADPRRSETDPGAMSQAATTLDPGAPIDLAREPDFGLGTARVHPAIGEVSVGVHRIRLQPRVMQVLVALARAEGEVVSRDDLVASCWGGLAVGDDAINRCIGRLRRLAETEAPGAFTIETLPRIGYRLGRPRAEPASGSTSRRWMTPLRLGGAGLLAVLTAAAVWFAVGSPGRPSRGHGVAVAAFTAPPGDAWARMFADGLADEMASSLARSDLVSLPPGSSATLSGLERDTLSQRLGAAYTLSGRVQRADAQLAVTVSIDDAQRHERLWSADFRRDASQAQDLQSEIAAKVANVLQCALTAAGGQLDLETVRAYLAACDAVASGDYDAHVRDLFRVVVKRQPRFADAWARFALASATLSHDFTGVEAAAAASEARSAAKRALKIDPKAGLAYAALESLADDLASRQSQVEKGLAVAPDNALLNFQEAWILYEVGRVREAIGFNQRAVELDPLNAQFSSQLAGALVMHGFQTEGRALLERDARIWPNSIKAVRLSMEARYGDPAAALQLLSDPSALPPMSDTQLADWRDFTLARRSGDKARIAAYVAEVRANVAAGRLSADAGIVRLISFNAVEDVFQVAAQAAPDIGSEPFFRSPGASVRADPRFLPLMAKLGVLTFWRSTGKWADFCEAADRPYDCRAMAANLSS